ncbi:MAG: SEC-C domain-containing protein [Paracoccus denitrificans]|uniref:SEC-C domain-containing protein n=1 Tax=Paracoccus denitrificans TaxID=266 RepID=A0A533IA60_PARDE|nr:MAG: SEC-C domain-containing protein [Paracoccus denitrificans]
MKGRERNQPCWCGSGKKYKNCHLDRDVQPKENRWAALDLNRKAFSQKKCFARDVGLGDCEGGVIKAHTVSRGPNLARIAKNGHVLRYRTTSSEMNGNGGNLSFKRIGIKDASVFHGFCRKHDREIFSCIENEVFTGRPDQCLAIAYRTMSRELYGKDASSHLRETLRDADKGSQPFQQFIFQKMLDEMDTGNEAARREHKATHDALTAAVVASRTDMLSSLIFEFAAPIPFMFAGAWVPLTDLHGAELQKGYVDELLEQVFVSSFAGESSAMICISWRNIDGAPGKVIAEQLIELPEEARASACLQFVMKHVENVFFNPDWFDALDKSQKAHLDQLAADGLDLMGSVPAMPIRLDADFQLPPSVKAIRV